ncbi:MAG: cysteine-rich CWC family protein [Bacteroidales bacterium]|jgi:hypothetical protein|nr:cysteine-rich CWC family protein [Bacteroidales bacterium]
MRNVICPKCGKEFQCQHSKECFCNKYKLSEDTKKTLLKLYKDCLCEQCLKTYAE